MDFFRKYRHVLAGLLILFVALQIPIYWKQDRSLGLPARILYSLAYYPQSLWASVTGGVRSTLSQYIFLVSVAKENDRLKKQNAELRGKIHELREVSQENARLRGLLDMRERSQFEGVGTRIIGLDASAWFQSFTIDIGSNDGIEPGMPVVSEEGLVGTVVSVAGNSSKVLPIVDMNSAVDVVASRSRARGMLVGRGRERAIVSYLERSEDVREGDILVTSGLGGAYPPGLPVAIIREVRPKTYGLFQDAYVDTIARFSRLENLMVLRYNDGDKVPAYVEAPAPATAPAEVTAPTVAVTEEPSPEPPTVSKPVIPAQLKPPAAAESKPAPVAPKKKPAPKPETAPAAAPPPIEGGSSFMGGSALNLPAIPSAMPAEDDGPDAGDTKPVAASKPVEKPVEKTVETPAEKPVVAPAAEKPAQKPVVQPAAEATSTKPETKPIEKPADKPAAPQSEAAAPPAVPTEADVPLSGGTP
jgi:rod shape-determining protein MreC